MNVVKAGYSIIEENQPITKKIERVARVCYKSEDLIADGTDLKMLEGLISRQHYAMLEHANLVYEMAEDYYNSLYKLYTKYKTSYDYLDDVKRVKTNCRLRFTETRINLQDQVRYVVSGNLRSWIEFFDFCREFLYFRKNRRFFYCPILYYIASDIKGRTNGVIDYTFDKFMKGASEYDNSFHCVTEFSRLTSIERMVHECFSVLFTVDRGVTHELVRMRDCSFAQESTRYCNYSKGKFGNEITVIKPVFFDQYDAELGNRCETMKYGLWARSCEAAEKAYFELLENDAKPQEARDVLPQSVKADIVVTANLQEWLHIFELRACDKTGAAHPQMKEVMCPLCKEMKEKYRFAFGELIVKE